MTTKADLKAPALKHAGALVDVAPPPAPRAPWAERQAAYQRVRPTLEALGTGTPWTRERFIAHYRAILANPAAAPFAKRHATEALQNFGYQDPIARSRNPGEDDEPESAWHEPAEGAAGDITKRPSPPAALPLGIAEDQLERDFGGVRASQEAR